jgi:hypothetical protein
LLLSEGQTQEDWDLPQSNPLSEVEERWLETYFHFFAELNKQYIKSPDMCLHVEGV